MKITIGTKVEEQLMRQACRQALKKLGLPISQAALLRVLVGLMAEGKIDLDADDVLAYSAESYKQK